MGAQENVGGKAGITVVLEILGKLEETGPIGMEALENDMRSLLPKVLKDHLVGENMKDSESVKTLLHLVRNFAETWPAVFDCGEATGVGPYLFVLFPPLCGDTFQAIREEFLETIEILIGLHLAKDVWAGRALLSDIHRLFVDTFLFYQQASQGSAPVEAAKHACFTCFWNEFKADFVGDGCTIDISQQQNCILVHSAVTRLAKKMIMSYPHFLSDRACPFLEDLCNQMIGECDGFTSDALDLASCVLDHFPIPPHTYSLLGQHLVGVLRLKYPSAAGNHSATNTAAGAQQPADITNTAGHHTDECAGHLANCLQRAFRVLPPQVIHSLSEELLTVLLPILKSPTPLPLRQSLLACLSASVRQCSAHLPYLLLLPTCFDDADLQPSLVHAIRSALDTVQHSGQHQDAVLGGLDFDVEDVCDDMEVELCVSTTAPAQLRKRARAADVNALQQPPKAKYRRVIKSEGGCPDGYAHHAARADESMPAVSRLAWEVAVRCHINIAAPHANPNRSPAASSCDPTVLRSALVRMQTLFLCLDASIAEPVWVFALGQLEQWVSQDSVKVARRSGMLAPLLETVKRAAQAAPPSLASEGLARIFQTCISTVNIRALHSTDNEGSAVHEHDVVVVAGMMAALSSANSRPRVDSAVEIFERALLSSSQVLRVTAALELPFFLCRSPDALHTASRWVDMVCRLVKTDGKNAAAAPHIATALAHLSSALCCAREHATEREVEFDTLANVSLASFWGRRYHNETPCWGAVGSQRRSLLCCNERRAVCAVMPATKLPHLAPDPETDTRASRSAGAEMDEALFKAGQKLLPAALSMLQADGKSGKEGALRLLQALPVLLTHHRNNEDVETFKPAYSTLLNLAIGNQADPPIRGHAAFVLGSLVQRDGLLLARLSGHAGAKKGLQALLDSVRSVLRKYEPAETNVPRLEGCILTLAAMGAALHDSCSIEDVGHSLLDVQVELVMTSVHSLAAGHTGLTNTAYQAVAFLASVQGVKVEELVFGEDGWPLILTRLVRSLETDNLIPSFCQLYMADNANEGAVYQDAGLYVVPTLVEEKDERLIGMIAENLQLASPGELLVEHLDGIILHLYMISPEAKSISALSEAASFFHRLTGLDMYECARDRKSEMNRQVVEQIILRHVSTADGESMWREGRAVLHRALQLFSTHAGQDEVLKDFFPQFLNVQTKRNFRVSERSEAQPGQIVVLKVLKFIIPELRRHLDEFFPMILSTIRCAQQIVGLQRHACEVWHTLITTAGPKSLQLRTSLTQVVVTLLFLAEKHPEEVQHSLRLLLIEWKDELQKEITNIPYVKPLEVVPVLADVYSALQQEQHGVLAIDKLLQRHVHGISNDDEVVQMYALMELKGNLQLHRSVVVEIFADHIRHATAVALMRGIISVLLTRCSQGRYDLRIAACDCLGLIGAVDPSRIGLIQRERESMEDLSEDKIAVEMIVKHLVKIVRSGADTGPTKASLAKRTLNTVERAQLAIQMLLQFLNCVDVADESPLKKGRSHSTQHNLSQHPTREARPKQPVFDERGRNNWAMIPEDVQPIVRPFLRTSFTFNEDQSAVTYPIYRRDVPFINWVKQFARDLVQKAEGTMGRVLQTVRPLLRLDTSLAQYVLRHALLHVVCLGNDDKSKQIRDELLLVLEDARVLEDLVDEGVVHEVLEPTQFQLASSMPNGLEMQGHTDLVIQIEGVRRGVVSFAEGGRVTIASAFPAKIQIKHQKYTICQVSPMKEVEDQRDGSGIKSVTQLVFSLVDDLSRWHERAHQNLKQEKQAPAAMTGKIQNVHKFLEHIPKRVLAETSERCAAYDRALLYLETHVREEWMKRWKGAQEKIALPPPLGERCDEKTVSLFQRIYVGLEDSDGLKGIAKLRARSSLEEQILDSQISGDWTAALACYEQALQQEPGAVRYHLGLLRCLRNLGHLQTMLTHADGGIARYPREAHNFRKYGLEAAWRLGRWDMVKEYLGAAQQNNDFNGKVPFDNHLSQILISVKELDQVQFKKHVRKARMSLFEPLAASSMESYQRAYPSLVKLQILAELEGIMPHFFRDEADTGSRDEWLQNTLDFWEQRLSLTQPSLMGREPLLAVRRTLFQMLGMEPEVAASWVAFSKAARLAAQTGTAQSAIMQAERFGAVKAHLERAKLQLSMQVNQHDALRALREYIDSHDRNDTRTKPEIYRKTLVMYWKQIQFFGSLPTGEVVAGFLKDLAVFERKVDKESEQTFFTLGHFYDTMAFPDSGGSARENGGGGRGSVIANKEDAVHLKEAIKHYAQSLMLGHKHIFQSLPRLLTLWFENSTNEKVDLSTKQAVSAVIQNMTRRVPSYIWLSVFSQLISRICHPNADVLRCLKNIIADVLAKHPKEALWPLVSVLRSQQSARSRPARDILKIPEEKDFPWPSTKEFSFFQSACQQLIGNDNSSSTGRGLVAELMKLCNITLNKGQQLKNKQLSMRQDCRSLCRITPGQYGHVLVPTQEMLFPTLPSSGKVDAQHNPFPDKSVTIQAFGDQIDVMNSLMAPVVIRITGSDGVTYKFLCKPKDDLRKDSRMMDFNTMINRLLVKDVDSRRRNLYIRTFSVVPLNESTGMIQWVDNTTVLRSILTGLYQKTYGAEKVRTNRLAELYDLLSKEPKQRGKQHNDMYNKELKPRGKLDNVELYWKIRSQFPPIFHRWFLDNFADPAAWVAARKTYVRTTAVWSMVGYVVGLGDRHAENILFDSTNGDCVHVDFSCLFNKGETLQIPEKVPFRLTANMIDPMGVAGYEGAFTNICCVVMRVLRENRDALMNVLETFAHDPLVEWVKKDKDEGHKLLSKCERRLRGEVTRFPASRDICQVLSVDGQVRAVIAEAASATNQADMYKWWMPWY